MSFKLSLYTLRRAGEEASEYDIGLLMWLSLPGSPSALCQRQGVWGAYWCGLLWCDRQNLHRLHVVSGTFIIASEITDAANASNTTEAVVVTKEPTTNATVTNSSEETTKAATYNSSRIWGSVCITTAATTVDTSKVAGTEKTNKAASVEEKPTAGDTKNIDDISLTGMNLVETKLVGDEAVVSSWPIYDDMSTWRQHLIKVSKIFTLLTYWVNFLYDDYIFISMHLVYFVKLII